MRRVTKRFALCLDNTGSEASLILGKVYRIVPDARAAKDDLLTSAGREETHSRVRTCQLTAAAADERQMD